MKTVTDPNGNVTTYGYVTSSGTADPFWRLSSVTDPLNNVNNHTYTPMTEESAMNFGTSSTVDTLSTSDGLGRPVFVQRRQAAGSLSFDSVQNTYSWNSAGQVTTQSVPYSGTAAQAAPSGTAVVTTQHDVLGRPLTVTDGGGGTLSYQYLGQDVVQKQGPAASPPSDNVKTRQLEYDGLGRLSSVCEVTTGTASWPGGNCGQTNSQTGYRTAYTYDSLGNLKTVSQNAQGTSQSRSYSYDGLSRLISETTPESGTTNYIYDTDSICGTSNGDLVKRVDAMGNVTCYAYDALHRNSGITYPSGPYAASTPSKTFVYDASSLFSCPTGANLKGRLAEAYTGSSGSKITDLGYCYSPRGETTDVYESTPHSGGYYHVPMTYWANGLMNSFGPFFNVDQAGYIPDGEGRVGSVYYIHAGYQYLAAPSVTYNAASQVTQLMANCANGTSCYPMNYNYDPNSLRMTQYSAALNGGTISGTLTWNPNGSLKTLAVADPFNTADNQTCNYSADDLSRLASVNCGSAWAQTFSYDPFGNITKSGSISWMPGYNAATNHYSLTGTSYDADGNVTNDSYAAYAYDADGKNLSANHQNGPWAGQTWSFINDAFGHRVELSINGTYVYSYLTLGKYRLSATGQTAQYSEFPYPGGSVASTNGGATGTQLAGWLGSIFTFDTQGSYAFGGAHAPFGEYYNAIGPRLAFAGNGGISWGESGDGATMSWFPERDYNSTQARWLTPDPAGMAAVDPSNPQTWNRYAYVMNAPLTNVDPDGTGACSMWGAGCQFVAFNGMGDLDFSQWYWAGRSNCIDLASCIGSSIFTGENSTNWSLGPSVTEILSQVLNGNYSALGVPTLGDLMDNAWALDAGLPNQSTVSDIVAQLKNCSQYAFIGNDLASMQNSGRVTFTAPPIGYASYDPWTDEIKLSPTDNLEPVSLLHEWRHHVQRRKLTFLPYKLLALPNAIQGWSNGTNDGFMDNIAERDAQNITKTCGLK